VLREIFGHNKGEVIENWRTLRDEERNDLYERHMLHRGEEKCIYGSVENPVVNRPLPRPSGRWEDTIKTYLKEIGRECMDWIHEAQK
jgi:hypothetical protein